jgi:hypothetical protein
MSNEPKLQELVALYAMISKMRVLSLPRTVTCAEKIMKATVDTYFAPNKTVPKVHELVKRGGDRSAEGLQRRRALGLRAFSSL